MPCRLKERMDKERRSGFRGFDNILKFVREVVFSEIYVGLFRVIQFGFKCYPKSA
jgi:hypothetical protein